MKTVTASEARTHLYRLLRDAEDGRTVRILRNGRVIDRIEPIPPEPMELDPKTAKKAFETTRYLRKRTEKTSVDELLSTRDEGRR